MHDPPFELSAFGGQRRPRSLVCRTLREGTLRDDVKSLVHAKTSRGRDTPLSYQPRVRGRVF